MSNGMTVIAVLAIEGAIYLIKRRRNAKVQREAREKQAKLARDAFAEMLVFIGSRQVMESNADGLLPSKVLSYLSAPCELIDRAYQNAMGMKIPEGMSCGAKLRAFVEETEKAY